MNNSPEIFNLFLRKPHRLSETEMESLSQLTEAIIRDDDNRLTVDMLYEYHDRLMQFQRLYKRKTLNFKKLAVMEERVWSRMLALIAEHREKFRNHNVEVVCSFYTKGMGEQ